MSAEGFTTQCDMSKRGKVRASGVGGWAQHIGRDVEERAGRHVDPGNDQVDPARTHLNWTFVNDGQGGWRTPKRASELVDYARESIQQRTGKVLALTERDREQAAKDGLRCHRKDAVPIRGIVLSLDSEWVEANDPDWRINGPSPEHRRLLGVMVDQICEEFGQENVLGGAGHADENQVQVQLGVLPVTKDGRLSQQDFFPDGDEMSDLHLRMRLRLRAEGYDAKLTVGPDSTVSRDKKTYGQMMDQLRAEVTARAEATQQARLALAAAVADAEAASADRAAAVTERAEAQARSAALDDREAQLDTKVDEVNAYVTETIPKLRAKAKADGREEGLTEGREEGHRAGYAVGRAQGLADGRQDVQQAAQALRDRLAALDAEVAADPAPEVPTLSKAEVLAGQPDVWRTYLRKHPKVDAHFERFAQAEYAQHQRRNTNALGQYVGAKYETWRQRRKSTIEQALAEVDEQHGVTNDQQYD